MEEEKTLEQIKKKTENASKVVYFKGYLAVITGLSIVFGGLFVHYSPLLPIALGVLALLYCVAEWMFAKSVKEIFSQYRVYYLYSVFNLLLAIAFFLSLALSDRFQAYLVYVLVALWMAVKGVVLLKGVLDMKRFGVKELFFFTVLSILTIVFSVVILFSLERRAIFVAVVFAISFISSGLAEIALSHSMKRIESNVLEPYRTEDYDHTTLK